jgi:CBS domain-containing protein
MAFFILTKGNLSQIDFDYLTHNSGSRLDPTLAPREQRPVIIKREEGKDTFALEVMSSPVITIDHESFAKEAIELLKNKGIHHLVLTEVDQVKGLVSDRDISWLKKIDLDEHAMAGQFMASMILVCHEETPIDHLARVMVREHISAIPVVNNLKQLTGIVTHHDLLRWIFE